MFKNRIITAVAIIIFLSTICLVPSCNPVKDRTTFEGGGVEQETLLVVPPTR